MQHAQIFKNLLEKEPINQRMLAKRAGMHYSKINRFLNSAQDLNAGELFTLLDLMNVDFQIRYWKLLLPRDIYHKLYQEIDAEDLVKTLPPSKQIRVMRAIAENDLLFSSTNSTGKDLEAKN
ncbi:MAG: helix-turn-helix transcriptional regulator [Prochloraceae cyanobacterium]|nr:helix-turn-helix transcriptional regulator [Prochloraceae cyanobacterium]